MNIHPAAKAFPDLPASVYKDLLDGIRKHGQLFPIIIFNGEILDGRNRLKACRELGVEPNLQEWTSSNGTTPVDFVIQANINRRDLTADQKAAIIAELMPKLKMEAKERQRKSQGRGKRGAKSGTPIQQEKARDVAAKQAGVSHTKVDQQVKLASVRPDLHEKVKSGEMKHSAAMKEAFPTPHDVAKSNPAQKWYEALHKVYSMIAGSRDAGGIQEITKGWSHSEIDTFLAEVKNLRKELLEWERQLARI